MEKIIKSSTINIPLSLHKATVIHANKYSEFNGATFQRGYYPTLVTDVVFRLDGLNEDWSIRIKKLDLPVYTNEAVTIVSTQNIVLAYIDNQTNHFYYITNDFSNTLRLGMHPIWIWMIGVIGAIIIFSFSNGEVSAWMLLPILITWIVSTIQKRVLHSRVKKHIDNFLT